MTAHPPGHATLSASSPPPGNLRPAAPTRGGPLLLETAMTVEAIGVVHRIERTREAALASNLEDEHARWDARWAARK